MLARASAGTLFPASWKGRGETHSLCFPPCSSATTGACACAPCFLPFSHLPLHGWRLHPDSSPPTHTHTHLPAHPAALRPRPPHTHPMPPLAALRAPPLHTHVPRSAGCAGHAHHHAQQEVWLWSARAVHGGTEDPTRGLHPLFLRGHCRRRPAHPHNRQVASGYRRPGEGHTHAPGVSHIPPPHVRIVTPIESLQDTGDWARATCMPRGFPTFRLHTCPPSCPSSGLRPRMTG
eukprot:351473-Chlamydomonas_euryale.AAC.2